MDIKDICACIKKSEKDAAVKKLLAALGVKRVPAPRKEKWTGLAHVTGPLVVLNGYARVLAPGHGVALDFDFPADRDGFTERPLSHKGPRFLLRATLLGERVRLGGKAFAAFPGPILLDWSITERIDVLRARARERGKAYARGSGETPDSIRVGKVCFAIYRKRGNALAERVELE